MTPKIKSTKAAKNQTLYGVEFYEISDARPCDSPDCNSPARFIHWYGPGQCGKCQKCHDKSIAEALERHKRGGKSVQVASVLSTDMKAFCKMIGLKRGGKFKDKILVNGDFVERVFVVDENWKIQPMEAA